MKGKIRLLMEIKIISWNMRGSNDSKKLYCVQRLVAKHKPVIVG